MLTGHVLSEGARDVNEVIAVDGRRNFAEIGARIAERFARLNDAATPFAQPVDANFGTNEIGRRDDRRRSVEPGETDVGAVDSFVELGVVAESVGRGSRFRVIG